MKKVSPSHFPMSVDVAYMGWNVYVIQTALKKISNEKVCKIFQSKKHQRKSFMKELIAKCSDAEILI